MKINHRKRIMGLLMPLTTALVFLCVSGGNAATPYDEAKEKLIEQCIRQMTGTGGDGAGRGMSFQTLQKLGPEAKSAVPALTKALEHEDSYIRNQAAYTLWKVDRQTKAIISLGKTMENDDNPADREAAAELLKKIDQQLAEEADAKIGAEKKATAEAEAVAKAFITALVNKNVDEAAKFVIPAEREELKKEMEKGMPPLPRDPQIQIRIKDDGIQADVSLLNGQKPASGPPFGLDMRFSEGKWWIVK
ncbi:HEAT repeat domain-containing protein [Akkermansiaceae bacterium]|nr:HEAT repeat domain-containing protein [Akkermansiaceae bacterium]